LIVTAYLAADCLSRIGTGFAAAVSRVGAGLGTFLLPWSMTHFGTSVTMLIAAGIRRHRPRSVAMAGPRDEGKSLTETAAGYSH
jgi:putative MFS transporter